MLDPNQLHAAALFAVHVMLAGCGLMLVALGAIMLRADRGRLARRACSDAR